MASHLISRELAQGVEADRWRENCSSGTFKGGSFYKYGAVKCILPDCFGKWADTIKNFEVKEDDIWVISFPKCGTTWTQELVWLLGERDYKRAEIPIHERSIFLEVGPIVLALSNEALTLKKAAEMPSPRYIKSHLPFSLLPSGLVHGVKPKVVYVARNPKDACVSFYYHSVSMNGYTGTFEDFTRSFLSDNAIYSPYWKHLKEACELKKGNANILFMTYEEMKEDLRASIMKVAYFLEKPLEDSELETLVQHLDFNSMKDNQAVNYESALKDNEVKYGRPRTSNFMRKGEVGNWREEFLKLPSELLEEFDRWNKLNGIEGMWEKYL